MKNLIHEIHRRSMWQVLGIYLAGSWVALQVVETLTESMTLPEWVQPFALVLLIIGLPIVLATAFVQEGMGGRVPAAPEPPPPPDRATRPGQPSGEAPVSEGTRSAPTPAGPPVHGGAPPARPRDSAGLVGRLRHGYLNWRNAFLGGVGAFTLLGLLLVGWLASRALGVGPGATLVAKGVLEDQATIVLSDFESDDENLGRAATEAFRIDLSQSRVVRLADPAFVRTALSRMERDESATLTLPLAREVAQREGLPAVLHGEILSAGGRYVVSASLISADDGAVLTSHRETAGDSSEIIDAIDATSNRLRERIGESLPDLRDAVPLERVTTGDLEALRLYSQGSRLADTGEEERAVTFLEEAIARDTTFAMAHRKLAVLLRNRNEQRARSVEALERAFAHRERLTPRERYLTMATYYFDVENDLTKAAAAYESLLEINPNDDWALNNAGIIYGTEQRNYERAEPMFQRAIEIDTLSAPPYFNLAVVQAAQGKLESVDSTIALWARRLPSDTRPIGFAANRAFMAQQWDEAEQLAQDFIDEHGSNPALAANGNDFLANTMAVQGRIREAKRRIREAEAANLRRDLESEALGSALGIAWMDLALGDTTAALASFEAATDRYPVEELDPLDRPHAGFVFFMASAGQLSRAREYLEAWERAEETVDALPVYWRARGTVESVEGDLPTALSYIRRGDAGACVPCAQLDLAKAFDRAGQPDSAAVYYEGFLDAGMLFRAFLDAGERGWALKRLGEIHDQAGDLDKASRFYGMFVALWEDADPELQPRVDAARARLEQILRETG